MSKEKKKEMNGSERSGKGKRLVKFSQGTFLLSQDFSLRGKEERRGKKKKERRGAGKEGKGNKE